MTEVEAEPTPPRDPPTHDPPTHDPPTQDPPAQDPPTQDAAPEDVKMEDASEDNEARDIKLEEELFATDSEDDFLESKGQDTPPSSDENAKSQPSA